MPVILTIGSYKIWFFTNEGNPLEPIHVHVGENVSNTEAKFWINSDGTCELESNPGEIPKHTLNKISKTISNFSPYIKQQWNDIHQEISFKNNLKDKYER